MTEASSGRVLVIGDVMTDVIAIPEGPLVRGSDRRAAIVARPGGSGANQAVWFGSMGVPVRFAGRVGLSDKPRLEQYFRQRNVEPVFAGDAAASSGALVTIVHEDGERSFLTDRGANVNLCATDLPETLLDDVRVLMISGYALFSEGPRAAVLDLVRMAADRSIMVGIDAASEGFLREVSVDTFSAWTAGIHTLLANGDEAALLAGEAELEAQVRALGTQHARVIIKRGRLGAAIGDRHGIRLSLLAPEVKVVDSTGAGDAFCAGFFAAELAGESEEVALRRAIAAGSLAVQHVGGQPD